MKLSTQIYLTNIALLFCNQWCVWKLQWLWVALGLLVPMTVLSIWGRRVAKREHYEEIQKRAKRLRHLFRVVRTKKP